MKKRSDSSTYYEIANLLGEGLNSCVYRAFRKDEKTSLTQEVALKILKSKKLVHLWRAEFETLRQVRSPHCLSVFGWEWIEDKPALVLECVDGLSLNELFRQTDLSIEEASEVFRQIQCGLEHLRQLGLCHGDLSLKNILINRKGLVKLVDFGLGNLSLIHI